MAGSTPWINFTASECPYSGPDCTYGVPWAYKICTDFFHPGTFDSAAKGRVIQCILSTLTEYEKVGVSTAQYGLTLWPAIVGIIGAFGPDAADIACDNLWWSTLLAVTSGALPGLGNLRPSHHIEVDKLDKGDTICREWELMPERSVPQTQILYRNKRSKKNVRAKASMRIEWVFFFLGLATYLAFNVHFGINLTRATLLGYSSPLVAGTWYWLAAMPATLAIFAEIIQDRVDLYEPATDESIIETTEKNRTGQNLGEDVNKPPQQTISVIPHALNAALAPAVPYRTYTPRRFHKVSGYKVWFFAKWIRVVRHQWHRRADYRVLVRPQSQAWYFQFWNLIIGLVRVTLFALGSVSMGNLLLYPQVQDRVSFILLVIATTVPRVTWSGSWIHGAGGADLVVWIRPTDIDDY